MMDPDVSEPEPPQLSIKASLELKPTQRAHYTRLVNRLGLINDNFSEIENYAVIDTSSTGSGKSIIGSIIAANMMPKYLIVFTYLTILAVWEGFVAEDGTETPGAVEMFNIPPENTFYFTYDDLIARGNKSHYTNAGITKRRDNGTYKVTKEFRQMVHEGVLVIFDEADALKNDTSARTKSAFAITEAIKQDPKRSRILYMTATVTDKDEKKYVWLHHLGLTNTVNLTNYVRIGVGKRGYYTASGILDIEDWLINNRDIIESRLGNRTYDTAIDLIEGSITRPEDGDEDERIRVDYLPDVDTAAEYVYDEIVVKLLSSGMPNIKDSSNLAYTLLTKNLFPKKVQEEIEKELDTVLTFVSKGNSKSHTEFFQRIIKFMVFLEIKKAQLLAGIIANMLEDDPNHKIVVQFNYHDALDALEAELKARGIKNILKIYGSFKDEEGKKRTMQPEEREKNRKKFQQYNDKYRIMLLSSVGDRGISLDDTSPNGEFPRTIFVPSSYNTTSITQTLGRIFRTNTTSPSVGVLVMYSLDEKLLARHKQKIKTLRRTTKMGSIPITDLTPFVEWNPRDQVYEYFIFKYQEDEEGKLMEYREYYNLDELLQIGEFNEEAYIIYRENNPIDTSDAYTPKSPSILSIDYLTKKGKQDNMLIATDLEVDTQRMLSLSDRAVLKQLSYFLKLTGSRDKAVEIVSFEMVEDPSTVKKVDYWFPGFRQQQAKSRSGSKSPEQRQMEKMEALEEEIRSEVGEEEEERINKGRGGKAKQKATKKKKGKGKREADEE